MSAIRRHINTVVKKKEWLMEWADIDKNGKENRFTFANDEAYGHVLEYLHQNAKNKDILNFT